jgi:hypothetical protein
MLVLANNKKINSMNFIIFFERDLNKLAEELRLYKEESDIWKTKEGINNSAGNLALHLIGNLNHFIGYTLGDTHYTRDREKEFSLKNVPRQKIIDDIMQVLEMIKNTFPKLSEEDLKKEFPVRINNEIFSTENMLLHLIAHLNYHLGQVNYHRRMI